jgi:two-component system chemotaxis response regulator CheB
MSLAYQTTAPPRADQPVIRVMIVDDAVVVRGLVSRWLVEEPGFAVVAACRTGREAVEQIERADPDVIILDVEMPDLDGLSALPQLLGKKRDVAIIMASTLTRRNAEVSLKALSLGAQDYIPKPESNREVTTSSAFRRDLIDKVRHLGARRQRFARPAHGAGHASAPGAPRVFSSAAPMARPAPAALHAPAHAIRLRPYAPAQPRVLLIGSSTGGPQALAVVIKGLQPILPRIPVLITQHMPPTFTTILAEHMGRAGGRPSREATHGEPIQPGTIYVAPGGKHMLVEKRGPSPVLVLDDGPPVNFCKPAVDPLFQTAAAAYGGAAFGLVLTGMGSDGAVGAGALVAAGGSVVAQDEATSVVWGMPGATAQAGHCSDVLPLDAIAPKLVRIFSGDRM